MKPTLLLLSAAVLGLPLLGAAPAALAQGADQADGRISAELGLVSYRYREPGVITLRGAKAVAQLGASFDLAGTLQLQTELRYAGGDVDYRADAGAGGGAIDGRRDYYGEARALLGRPLQLGGQRLLPYAGLGYRYLFNDLRGVNSVGQSGSRRDNRLLYLPLGVMLALPAGPGSTLTARVELDPLLAGRQRTRVSDADPAFGDVSTKQRHGVGAKLQLSYGRAAWRLTPYLDYWRIGASDTAPLLRNGAAVIDNGRQALLGEPRNHTVEAGVLVGYRF
jgi:hypothetical protein